MKVKNKFKPEKLKSKKGVTLVELLVGITIVVIVFAATLGAMSNGFTTTLTNADHNREAVKNASVNEVLLKAVKDAGWKNSTAVKNDMKEAVTNDLDNAIHMAAKTINDDIYFIPHYKADDEFPSGNHDYEYTIIPDVKSTIDAGGGKKVEIAGVRIMTYSKSSAGTTIYESFVPYSK